MPSDPNQQIIDLLTRILEELQLHTVTNLDPGLRNNERTTEKIKSIRSKSKDINKNASISSGS